MTKLKIDDIIITNDSNYWMASSKNRICKVTSISRDMCHLTTIDHKLKVYPILSLKMHENEKLFTKRRPNYND